MTEISKLIMKIYSDLGIKIGSGLLVQNIRDRTDLEYNEDIPWGLGNLVEDGSLAIKNNEMNFFFLTPKGGDYIKDVKNQSREMESRNSELKEDRSEENKGKEIMSITADQIKKLTIPQLCKLLSKFSLGAWVLIFVIQSTLLTISHRVGYKTGISETVKDSRGVKRLTGEQKLLLNEIWKYQKENNLNKVIISRNGVIFDDSKNQSSNINLAEKVFGDTWNLPRFDKLITSMPSYFLKLIPESRLGSPYVVTIPLDAQRMLEKDG